MKFSHIPPFWRFSTCSHLVVDVRFLGGVLSLVEEAELGLNPRTRRNSREATEPARTARWTGLSSADPNSVLLRSSAKRLFSASNNSSIAFTSFFSMALRRAARNSSRLAFLWRRFKMVTAPRVVTVPKTAATSNVTFTASMIFFAVIWETWRCLQNLGILCYETLQLFEATLSAKMSSTVDTQLLI